MADEALKWPVTIYIYGCRLVWVHYIYGRRSRIYDTQMRVVLRETSSRCTAMLVRNVNVIVWQ